MSSNKPLSDSVGHLEYLLLGLTFLGVMYLVMKQAKVNVSLDNMQVQSSGVLGHRTVTDSTTHAGSGPHEGMGSQSGNEQPVFHLAPYDPNELVGPNWNMADDSDPDFNSLADARRRDGLMAKAAVTGYGKGNHNDGMQNLMKAMSGH